MLRLIFPVLTALFLLFGQSACNPDYPEATLPEQETVPSPATPSPSPSPSPAPVIITPPPAQSGTEVEEEEIAAEPGLLRVGFSDESPPLIFKNDDKIQGIEADLLKQFGDLSKKKLEFIPLAPKKAGEALRENRIDIVSMGLKISPPDKGSDGLIFSDPYLRSGQILMVKKGNIPLFVNGIYNIEGSGMTIAVMSGSSGEVFLKKNIRGIKIMRFKTTKNAVKALNLSTVDAFLHDAPFLCAYAEAHPTEKLAVIKSMVTEDFLGWQIRQDDEELRRQMNLFLRKSKSNGQLQQTIKQWIPNL
jgi:polar amino acid transport system substrate-binding protein